MWLSTLGAGFFNNSKIGPDISMIQFYCGSKGCVGGPDNYSQSYEKISGEDSSFAVTLTKP